MHTKQPQAHKNAPQMHIKMPSNAHKDAPKNAHKNTYAQLMHHYNNVILMNVPVSEIMYNSTV